MQMKTKEERGSERQREGWRGKKVEGGRRREGEGSTCMCVSRGREDERESEGKEGG